MLRSLYTAASGMKGNQLYIDSISNNLSNVNTAGFKKTRVDFQDLIYQTLEEPGGIHANGAAKPSGVQLGLGVAPAATTRIFSQGQMLNSGNATDVAIDGDGFFQVKMPDGGTKYTREGAFKISGDGYLVNTNGYPIDPPIQMPSNVKGAENGGVMISPEGIVSVRTDTGTEAEEVGRIELARFINPAGLRSEGGNLYSWTEAAGETVTGRPGESGLGQTRSGFLEASNVQMVEEMVNMILAQRAYEINSKAITTSDDMLQTANQLKS